MCRSMDVPPRTAATAQLTVGSFHVISTNFSQVSRLTITESAQIFLYCGILIGKSFCLISGLPDQRFRKNEFLYTLGVCRNGRTTSISAFLDGTVVPY